MASSQIIPTRMELSKQKRRLTTATRGHKLLKDKRDELMRQFMDVIRLNKELRDKVEAGLSEAFAAQSVASAVMTPEMMEQALIYTKQHIELDVAYKNVMSVNVPRYSFTTGGEEEGGDIHPYSFLQTSGELDDAMTSLQSVFNDMLELAEVEKSMQLLAQEIEKTRRRVNALEYVMIPELQENIKYITMKLAENENSTKVRLMKVKEMVLEQAHHYKERGA